MANETSIRTAHRWVAVVFTVVVLANIVNAVFSGPVWVGYVALAPLALLFFSGLYLLLSPYLVGRRTASRRTA